MPDDDPAATSEGAGWPPDDPGSRPYIHADKLIYFRDRVEVGGDFRSDLTGRTPDEREPPPRVVRDDVSVERPLHAEVDRVLTLAGPRRAPILVAIETTAQRLADEDLLKTQRHLTVTLTPEQLERCGALAGEAADCESLDELVMVGTQVWSVLVAAQPRLKVLLEKSDGAGFSQPVAWAGRAEHLQVLHAGLLMAHTGEGEVEGFVSVAYGGHYLLPVVPAGEATSGVRSMRPRMSDAGPDVAVVRLGGGDADSHAAAVRGGTSSEVVMLRGSAASRADLGPLVTVLSGEPIGRTRALLTFGCLPPGAQEASGMLQELPFLSFADESLDQPDLRRALEQAVRRHAATHSMPCIVAAVRGAWLHRAVRRGDVAASRHGLAWSSWSWVGLPLFSTAYDEPRAATYPHLMDLRSVAGSGWYFNRRSRVPEDYVGERLARPGIPAGERFHLYLSGAGGTGKSCFLRFVHDELRDRQDRLTVWYRVDAPSSSWDNVQERVREETLAAMTVHDRLGPEVAEHLAAAGGRLASFLREAATWLRANRDPDFEIVLFIDQLERTFESGDEPEPSRLDVISTELLQLLDDVKVGEGVRVFIASRKQYLPDFLRSSRTATDHGLHFNVLQAITDTSEQVAFVRQVTDWCRREHLIGPDADLSRAAAERVVQQARGNPLNIMLALIHLLSEDVDATIPGDDDRLRNIGERLFALDLRAAAQDELDWTFLLAMAHARTEIVRFEEVWWRLRMVRPPLTQRVDVLGPDRVLERLWLMGFLGRTIHARPAGRDPARYLEFFHANLRDYLLQNVMARSGAGPETWGRPAGTPDAWRALDRLSAYAHDWEQTQQVLPAEDVRVLMEHRLQVVERASTRGANAGPPFRLLFLRDQESARERLSVAAMECFVLSALVHDDMRRWAFKELFPEPARRIDLCFHWLLRCPPAHRVPILRYVLELDTEAAWERLITSVLRGSPESAGDLTRALAEILNESLYAARYRKEFLSAVINAALADRPGGEVPMRAVSLVVSSCGWNRETLVGVLAYAAERWGSERQPWSASDSPLLADPHLADRWLDQARDAAGLFSITGAPDRATGFVATALSLSVGSALAAHVDPSKLSAWTGTLRQRLGVPLPPLQLVNGENDLNEIEFRSTAGRIHRNVFYPDRVCVLRRHWQASGVPMPAEAVPVYEEATEEDVVWLPLRSLRRAGYTLPARTFDDAVVDWLEAHSRRSFGRLFDMDLLAVLVRMTSAASGRRWRLPGLSGEQLRQVVVELVEEGVPLENLVPVMNEELSLLLAEWERSRSQSPMLAEVTTLPEMINRKLREVVASEISRSAAEDPGQVMTTMLLDAGLEAWLADQVDVVQGRIRLKLDTATAAGLASAVRRQAARVVREDGRRLPVLVTSPALRYPLARLLRQFDHRLRVLSFAELDPGEVILERGGLIAGDGIVGRTAP